MPNSLRCKIKKWCYQGKITEKERDRLIQGLNDTDRIKKINDIKMRDATPEERESIDKYIKSISKPTGVDFWDLEQEPCDDAISRQAVINAIANTCFWLSSDNWEELMKCINSIPPVNSPNPNTGHWIMDRKRETRQCDKCMTVYRWSFNPHNYCPNCGAEMREGE